MSRATELLDEATAESKKCQEVMAIWGIRILGIDAETFADLVVELEDRLGFHVGAEGLKLAAHSILLGAWLAQRATREGQAASESVS